MRRNWKRCTGCGLHCTRRHVALGRGKVPANIMFIGGSPSKVEDVRGKVFIDRSAKLLAHAVEDACKRIKLKSLRIYYSNVVACRATDDKNGSDREPTGEEALACWERLEKSYYQSNPTVLIFLGKVAASVCGKAWPHGISLVHPSSILNKGGEQSTEYRKLVQDLCEAFKPLKKGVK